jgi:hypothetical protein
MEPANFRSDSDVRNGLLPFFQEGHCVEAHEFSGIIRRPSAVGPLRRTFAMHEAMRHRKV